MFTLHRVETGTSTQRATSGCGGVLGAQEHNQMKLQREPIATCAVLAVSLNCELMYSPGANLNFANVCDAVQPPPVTDLLK